MQTAIPSGSSRFSVRRGFYAVRAGQFGLCNPGDVVDINQNDAKMLRAADKGDIVGADVSPKLDANYVRAVPAAQPTQQEVQLKLLTDAVLALQKSVETQTEAFKALAKAK